MLKRFFILSLLLCAAKAYSQALKYEAALQESIAHRQAQNASHVVSWDTTHFLLSIDSFLVDQSKEQLTVQSGRHLVKYNIKILGTYDHKDSTFLWSTYNSSILKNITSPVSYFLSVAAANKWNIANTRRIKCSFDSAYNLATFVFYLDKANGIDHIMTNNGRTNVIFSFYEVEIYDKATNRLIKKVPVQKQYSCVEAPALIAMCKNYVTEFDANEKKYADSYKQNNDAWKYADTLFANRVKISDKYWDTTSLHYEFFRTNRVQAQDLGSIINWRVIELEGSMYVLYDEKEVWGGLKTWAFKICQVKGEVKICNEYLCF